MSLAGADFAEKDDTSSKTKSDAACSVSFVPSSRKPVENFSQQYEFAQEIVDEERLKYRKDPPQKKPTKLAQEDKDEFFMTTSRNQGNFPGAVAVLFLCG